MVASVLEAIGFEVALIIIPNHMFVGWHPEQGGSTLEVLETTLLNNKDATFADANEIAREEFTENVTDKTIKSGDAQVIMLDDVRSYGIMPNDVP